MIYAVGRLALATDKYGRWRTGNPRIADDLQPRVNEPTKSAWSHHPAPDNEEELEFASRLPEVSSQVAPLVAYHALLLFVNKHRGDERRDSIHVATFARACLADFICMNSADSHMIAALDQTHCDLYVGELDVRTAAVQSIVASGSVVVFSYTRDQLRPLFHKLLDRGMIRNDFQEAGMRAFLPR